MVFMAVYDKAYSCVDASSFYTINSDKPPPTTPIPSTPSSTTTNTRLATPPVAVNEPPSAQHGPNNVNHCLGYRKFFHLFIHALLY
jgi:hypothetical protein